MELSGETLTEQQIKKGTQLDTDAFEPTSTEVPSSVTKIGGTIYQTIRIIGIVVAVITLIIIGITYMMGSVEEKAEYKKRLIPYIIGAFLVGGGSVLISIIGEIKW